MIILAATCACSQGTMLWMPLLSHTAPVYCVFMIDLHSNLAHHLCYADENLTAPRASTEDQDFAVMRLETSCKL